MQPEERNYRLNPTVLDRFWRFLSLRPCQDAVGVNSMRVFSDRREDTMIDTCRPMAEAEV